MDQAAPKINPREFQERLDQLNGILTAIAQHADEISTSRCPYKNRFDQCTARFGCRNQRRPKAHGALPICGGDDQLDYRKAWEAG